MADDAHLRGEYALAVLADGVVDVRRAELPGQRVRDWPDRPEDVVARRVRKIPAVSLEVGVLLRVAPLRVDVGLAGVALPDLDHRIADRLARLRQQTARHPGDVA